MSHLQQFYEEIEIKLFDKIYNKEIEISKERTTPELEKLRKFLQSKIDASNVETVNDLGKALRKCTIRFYLSGRDENLQIKLDDFLFHPQLYDNSLTKERVIKFLEGQTQIANLFDIVIVYSFLYPNNQNIEESPAEELKMVNMWQSENYRMQIENEFNEFKG